ncbi:MAG: hypothetical protein JZU65_13000, partial [Chlorobium sp.]|nr:hypothetical protein [Chlorobium sp.]
GNKNWSHKLVYFRHLAETDPDSLAELERDAISMGVELAPDTIELLKDTSHKHHIRPLILVGSGGQWDKVLVEKRSIRICDIVWTRLIDWLN